MPIRLPQRKVTQGYVRPPFTDLTIVPATLGFQNSVALAVQATPRYNEHDLTGKKRTWEPLKNYLTC